VRSGHAYLCGTDDAAQHVKEALDGAEWSSLSPKQAIAKLRPIWATAVDPTKEKSFAALTENLTAEVALIERHPKGSARFKLLDSAE